MVDSSSNEALGGLSWDTGEETPPPVFYARPRAVARKAMPSKTDGALQISQPFLFFYRGALSARTQMSPIVNCEEASGDESKAAFTLRPMDYFADRRRFAGRPVGSK